ncbi:mannose-1-phosphate guanylyltransferase/mannose-6-phosphate isomerase [Amphritea balenae]|uniref:mannose-1-phosphate guanylyltransferase n=1 Tax=Amphritea balenae TaxID=452629 RepID=A0A3P1ST05_9GAMM|nr:mannose-1-phosphate guanylyltransferase/mannose-6-phosphate isomerase [Amphritea balenae]RRD00190.1 mannose-1-phosphate guanylyltransferase/mannose-6-phosphate isomerase [Amphritea balenae]GGK77440.1 mannose-1-phosphate guanylyltransferase [Amphritea balenae]
MIPVIMAGGSGTRLWPLSRTQYPKQFLPLNAEKTMLQETVARLKQVDIVDVICNEEHRFLAAEQMRQIGQNCSVLLEPVGRNTAPAIALAALKADAKRIDAKNTDADRSASEVRSLRLSEGAKDQDQSEILLVLAADHVIEDVAAFRDAVAIAEPLAAAGKMVTFGIVPTHAETGYGYIRSSKSEDLKQSHFTVQEFVEKPDVVTAEAYVDSGDYYWNSGMFMFRADRYLEELGKFRPDILEACQAAMAGTVADMDFVRVDETAFSACPDESIDYAVMEPLCAEGSLSAEGSDSQDSSDSVVVVPLDAGWSDVGSWSALWEIKDKDANNNVAVGDTILEDTTNSFVYAGDRLVTTLGVDDLVIVDTKDALLVARKDRVQDVKKIVNQIKAAERNEHFQHRVVYRPWGKYDSIDNGERYQAKRITVNPGAKLSLQKHHHRAEHWVVVSGTANVRRGDDTMLVSENESVYIPIGEIHSLENPGKIPLELIEVQSGSYLGEDDIVRLEDQYGRV